MAREMTTDQVRDFLGHRTRTAKVATVMQDGRPHVTPVWFVLDGEQLLCTTGADSVKGRNLRRDPRIALLVDDETPPYALHGRGPGRGVRQAQRRPGRAPSAGHPGTRDRRVRRRRRLTCRGVAVSRELAARSR